MGVGGGCNPCEWSRRQQDSSILVSFVLSLPLVANRVNVRSCRHVMYNLRNK